MRIKSVIGLEYEEQLIISEFADLVRLICPQDGKSCSWCYFKPLCPICTKDVVDSFCELWSEIEDIKVEKDE